MKKILKMLWRFLTMSTKEKFSDELSEKSVLQVARYQSKECELSEKPILQVARYRSKENKIRKKSVLATQRYYFKDRQ